MDQYMYAVKNGVYRLRDKYTYDDYEIDKLFNDATEIAYWRKNTAIQHYFCCENDTYIKITEEDIYKLIEGIAYERDEFGYEDYLELRRDYDIHALEVALGYIDDDFSIYYSADW